MRLWRLASERRARDFDGGYGISYDGRWNTRGRPVTYCSTVASLTALEKRVHVSDPALLPTQVLVTYELPDNISQRTIEIADLPADWTVRATHTQSVGDRWLDSQGRGLASRSLRDHSDRKRSRSQCADQSSPRGGGFDQHRAGRPVHAGSTLVQTVTAGLPGESGVSRAQRSMSSAFTIFSVCAHSGCAAHDALQNRDRINCWRFLVDRFHETNRIEWMELKPTDLILRRREAPSRRMAAGTISLVAVLRDARKRAPQDEVE